MLNLLINLFNILIIFYGKSSLYFPQLLLLALVYFYTLFVPIFYSRAASNLSYLLLLLTTNFFFTIAYFFILLFKLFSSKKLPTLKPFFLTKTKVFSSNTLVSTLAITPPSQILLFLSFIYNYLLNLLLLYPNFLTRPFKHSFNYTASKTNLFFFAAMLFLTATSNSPLLKYFYFLYCSLLITLYLLFITTLLTS